MYRKGDVIDNPVTGERATIRLGTRETQGDRLILNLELPGAGIDLPLHTHPGLHERLSVLSGRVGISLHGESSIAEAGAVIEIPAGTPHCFWNAGICAASVEIDIQPGRRFEAFLRNMVGLAQDGKTNQKGMPRLPELAVIATEFEDVVHFCKPPRLLQIALFPLLASIARMAGYRNRYSEYLFGRPLADRSNEAALWLSKQL